MVLARFVMLALNGPTAGDGDEASYNRWYDETHLRELRAVEGIYSARRYKVVRGNVPGIENWPYLAMYEIEADDMASVSRGMAALGPFHPTFDRSKSAHLLAIQISGDGSDDS